MPGGIISKALANADISHEEVTTIMNEADKHHKLLENIRMIKSQRSDIEKYKLIKGDKNGN